MVYYGYGQSLCKKLGKMFHWALHYHVTLMYIEYNAHKYAFSHRHYNGDNHVHSIITKIINKTKYKIKGGCYVS